MPKYMLIWRTTDAEKMGAAMADLSFDDMLEKMGKINDEFINAGVLLAAEGLDPEEHTVLSWDNEEPVVTDGPYGETKELFGGYYVIQVSSKEEAIEHRPRTSPT